ncbi:MAG: HAD family hydrolase [Sulfitobacter sp.]
MSKVKGLIFDKDGTLFDFGATWNAWAKTFLLRVCEGDLSKSQTVGAAIGFDFAGGIFARDSIVIASTSFQVAQALLPHFPSHDQDSLMHMLNEEAAKAPQVEAVPLVPFLSGLQAAGMKLGVATNDAEAPARSHLNAAGVTGYFDFIAGFDSGHGGKPQPGQLLAFATAVGLAPSEIAMVGDSVHDLDAGRAAGMHCVAVLTGMATRDDLVDFADVVLSDIGGLPDWIAA